MKLAVLGPEGTFSDIAAQLYIKDKKDIEIKYFSYFNEVIYALKNKICDIAITPIENTLDGFVTKTLDLIGQENVLIVDEITLPIRFKLISDCSSINEISKIYVQFKANGQCSKFLDQNKDKMIVDTESNMISYYKWKETRGTSAAIVPFHIECDAKMQIDTVADSSTNFTRFGVLIRTPASNLPYKRKATIMISHEIDKPGLLFNMLKKFYEYNINLTSIISRPDRKEIGAHNFYLDVEQVDNDFERIGECIEALKKQYKVKVLGIY